MRTCPQCGKSVNASAKHCGYCGFLLPLSSSSRTPTQFPPAEVSPAASAPVSPVQVVPATPPQAGQAPAGGPSPVPPPLPQAAAQPPPATPNPVVPAPAVAQPAAPQRSKTVFIGSSGPAPASGVPTPERSPERRIVGILVTYNLRPEGDVFPLREGRNIIGRDPAECDIAVPQDASLSAKNTFIIFRKSFVIADAMSMGGTDVDNEPVEEQKRLRNYAYIRTGNTYWTFISFDPQEDEIGG